LHHNKHRSYYLFLLCIATKVQSKVVMDKFDKFLQAKGPSSAAKSGVSSSASSSFERISAQFDKRFGQPRQSSTRTVGGTSSATAAAAAAAAVGVADEERQQSFTLGSSSTGVIFSRNSGSHLKARDLFLESTKKYNKEQDLYCHEGAHPDSYKLHELNDHSCGQYYDFIYSLMMMCCMRIYDVVLIILSVIGKLSVWRR
jgi:hypothetical protein